MNVLVLNYYSRNSLAVLHGLDGRHRIVGADEAGARHARPGWERLLRHPSVCAIERHAPPLQDPDGFVSDIVRICRRHRIDAVVPTGTTATNALSCHKDPIERDSGARCVVVDYDQLRPVTDKWHAYELAVEAGVPVPETRLFDPAREATRQVDGMSYPLVVKPRISYAAIGVHHVHDPSQFEELHARAVGDGARPDNDPPLIVQECIEGELHDVAACAQAGQSAALVTQQRVVTLYDFGGGGIVNLTTRDPGPAKHAATMLSHIGWDGPMLFDFIRTPEGKDVLLECNPKVWGTTDLAMAAGSDIVSMMLDIFVHGRRIEPIEEHEAGVLYRWWFPECLFFWFHRPLTPGRMLLRMKRTAARYGAQRVLSNLRPRDIRHLIGIVVNRLHARKPA